MTGAGPFTAVSRMRQRLMADLETAEATVEAQEFVEAQRRHVLCLDVLRDGAVRDVRSSVDDAYVFVSPATGWSRRWSLRTGQSRSPRSRWPVGARRSRRLLSLRDTARAMSQENVDHDEVRGVQTASMRGGLAFGRRSGEELNWPSKAAVRA